MFSHSLDALMLLRGLKRSSRKSSSKPWKPWFAKNVSCSNTLSSSIESGELLQHAVLFCQNLLSAFRSALRIGPQIAAVQMGHFSEHQKSKGFVSRLLRAEPGGHSFRIRQLSRADRMAAVVRPLFASNWANCVTFELKISDPFRESVAAWSAAVFSTRF